MASFVIYDVRIFTGEEVLESGSVLVEGGIIRYVGRDTPTIDLPIITASNSTLMPGLIDAHIHADKGQVLAIEQSLRFGVTTVLDMHNESWNVAKLKKIAAQRKDVADFKSACFGATVDQGWPAAIVKLHDHSEETSKEIDKWPKLKTPEDAEPFLLENIKNGCDYIKLSEPTQSIERLKTYGEAVHESGSVMGQSFNLPSLSLQSAVVKAAHAHNLLAVAHSLCLEDTLAILKTGVDGMMHTFADQPPTEELLETYKKNGAFCVPTLGALASATGEGKTTQQAFADDPRVADLIEETSRENMCRCMEFAAKTSKMENAYENVRQLRAAGIDILCGSDAASPAHGTAWGLSLHLELHYLVKDCGFTPEEALRTATSINARRFRLEDRGVIAVGRKADLILIKGNPLEDIGNTLNLKAVWRDGHRL